ncbi:hypothetical protein GTR02_02825 [Kineococcus sp. R8]|uniref:hypothetical protein n=1 Tax=Kineococcus siccus TaxID=2696567 RepID=UPI0014120C12|nr:hypothetical protein [Kineococcus siccus]NAZ80752.1 hypothetical protein [Kineococcus siccus]
MSSMLHPVGPERRATYWRRRLVVVLVLLALVAGVTVLVRSLGSDAGAQPAGRAVIDPAGVSPTVAASPTGSPTGAATPTPPTPSTSGAPVAGTPVACTPGQLEVTTTTDVPVYGPNVNPQLKVIVRNTAGFPCDARVGAGTRTLVVTDAAGAQVWSSADCSPSAAATTVPLLASGVEQGDDSDTTVMTQKWSLQRSAPGCPTGLPAVEPGTYTVSGAWGDVPLPRASFSLTR